MDRQLSTVLTETLEAAETQLAAARQLDAETLASATEFRQDLHFELELMAADEGRVLDDEIEDLLRRLRDTDQRLTRVLSAANGVFEHILQVDEAPTYGASGRMRER